MSEAKIRTMVVTGYWNDGNSTEIPDEVKFQNDGENYLVTCKQPVPAFKAVMNLIDKLPVYGPSAGGYKGRHTKK